jgi:beta-1,4-mannosyltransferase
MERSLDELVKDGKNGLIFKNAAQLAEQMEVGCFLQTYSSIYTPSQTLLTGFPNCPRLTELRSYLLPKSERPTSPSNLPASREHSEDVWESWDENWARYVRPLILRDVRRNGW